MIQQMNAVDNPEFLALALNVMLFKLGGQITMSLKEMSDCSLEYPAIRLAFNTVTQDITLTLRSREA